MKQPNHAEKRQWGKRFASGFMAFAMGLSFIPAPAVSALTLKRDALLDSVVSAEFSTESSSESNILDTMELIPQSTDTLDTYDTLPEIYPGMEGLLPSWDDDDEVVEEPSHWAAEYLEKMVDYGYMRSQDATAPDELLTRAEFMSVINRAYGYSDMGEMPFTDVLESDWYYDDVAIATNAGFVSGTSETTAEPLANMTRETTAFILGKNLMLPELNGENLMFEDSRDISDWSRTLVKSASVYGLMTGYDDNTFRPLDNITRAEISALVMKAVGTPILTAGDVTLKEVFGNVTITESGTVLKDTIIAGDLHISNGIGLGGAILENVVVLGRIVVSGGESNQGEASIILRNVVSSELVIDNMANNKVTVRIEGNSYIENTYARTNSYIEDNTTSENGLRTITIDCEPGTTVDFAGRIKEVFNSSPNTTVRVVDGSVDVMTIDESATEVMTEILMNAVVHQLNIDVATNVSGEGDIGSVNVNASDVVIEQLPDDIVIRPGVDANINGENMDSNLAEEYSSEPRILAGYPIASDIAPSSFDAIFSTNKPGTIYWSVSNVSAGSVPESELLAPPTYGSTGFLHGDLYVLEGEREDLVFIEGLPVGGSYYLTAILEDSKGALSPIKVISFSTPDDTIPEFAEGYPYMSFVGNDSAQVTVMATKSCKLYYAVLQAGALMPTPEDFLSGAVSGAEGYGIQDMTKNKEATFTVATGLAEQKDYVLYLWLTDADGMHYSEVVGLDFTTTDGTPPLFNQVPTVTKIGTNSADFSFSLNEDGTVYYIAVPAGTIYPTVMPGDTTGNLYEPWDSDYAKMQVANGLAAGTSFSGSVAALENQNGTFSLTGLALETAYDLYYVAMDLAGNYSDFIGMTTFNTIDNTPPEFVEQTFSHTTSSNVSGLVDQPYATTDITLVFSEGIQSTYFEGSTGRSFLQLYTAVKTATTPDAETVAYNHLAAALENCFPFYTVTGTSNYTPVVVRDADNEYDTDVYEGAWVIDYRHVTIELVDGLMYVTFPTVTNDGAEGQHRPLSALNLSSGVTYGFKLQNIQDSSSDANIMVPALLTLDKFTTVFAEVTLSTADIMVGNLPYKRDINGEVIQDSYARVDADLRITPEDMTNVSDTIVYDLRMNPNTFTAYNIYFRVVDKNGVYTTDMNGLYPTMPTLDYLTNGDNTVQDGGVLGNTTRIGKVENNFEIDNNGWIFLRMDDVAPTQNLNATTNPNVISGDDSMLSGVGLFYAFFGYQQNTTAYPKLADLGSAYQYELCFEVTKFNGTTTYGGWNGFLNIDTQMYAGTYSKVNELGPFSAMDAEMLSGLSLISTPPDYQVSKRFTDSIPPGWGSGVPKVETQSMSAELSLAFDGRAGTAFYAVVKSSNPSNLSPTDLSGSDVWSTDVPSIDSRFWVEGGQWPFGGIQDLKLSKPTQETILFNVNYTPQIVNTGTVAVDTQPVFVDLVDLDPLTEYYVYIITRSSTGGDYSDVYLYKFTTLETEKPKYDPDPTPNTNTGDVDVTTHVDTNLSYLMVSRSALANASFDFLTLPFYKILEPEGTDYLSKYAGTSTVQKEDDPGNYYTYEELYKLSKEYEKSDKIYIESYEKALSTAENYLTNTAGGDVTNKEYLRLLNLAEVEYNKIYTVLDVLTMEYNKADNYDHEDYSNGYTIFDVFASPQLKSDLYSLILGFGDRELLGKNTVETKADTKITATTDPNATKDPDFEYLFLVTSKNKEASSTSVAETNTFRAVDKYRIIDNSALKLVSSSTGGSESVDADKLPTGNYSGTLTLNFDKNIFATGAGSSAPVYFVQLSNEEPSEYTWPSGVTMHINDMMTYIPASSSTGSVALFTERSGPEGSATEPYSDYDPDLFAKQLVLSYKDVQENDQISFFGSQLYPSSSSGVTHSPQNLTFTFSVVKEDEVTTETSPGSGIYKTTIVQHFGWVSNWDTVDGTDVSHVADDKTHSYDTDKTIVNTISPNPTSVTVVEGATETVIVTVTPFGADGRVTVTNLNPALFSISNTNLVGTSSFDVKGIQSGTGTIHLQGVNADEVTVQLYINVTVTAATRSVTADTMSLSDTGGDYAVSMMSEEAKLSGGTYTLVSTNTGITDVTATIVESTGKLIINAGNNAKTGKGSVTVKHSSGAIIEVPIEVVSGPTVSLNSTSMDVYVGQKGQLVATTKNQGSDTLSWSVTSGTAAGLGFTTSSSSKTQYFTPTKTGTYKVTVELSSGAKAVCTINVTEVSALITMPTGESLKESSLSGFDYEWDVKSSGVKNLQITAPLNKYSFTVTSSDTDVATIANPNFSTTLGYKPVNVTIKEEGETTISIKNNVDGKTVKILVSYD